MSAASGVIRLPAWLTLKWHATALEVCVEETLLRKGGFVNCGQCFPERSPFFAANLSNELFPEYDPCGNYILTCNEEGAAMIDLMESAAQRREVETFIADMLGDGDHYIPICSPGPPTCVRVEVLGVYEGELECEVEIIDQDEIPLAWVVEAIERCVGVPAPVGLPKATAEDDEALRASLKVHGPQVPVLVDESGRILDGRRRQRLCAELAIPCPRITVKGLSLERKRQLIYELNLCRQHFTNEQKRQVAKAFLKACPFWSDRRIGRMAGIDHKTVAKVRRRLSAVGEVPQVQARIGEDDKQYKVKRVISTTPVEHQKALGAVNALPEHCNGKVVDAVTAERRANRSRKAQKRNAKENITPPDDSIHILHSRFQELEIEPATVNAIITEIPYGKAFLEQLPELADFAERVLVEGGLFVSHVGVGYLDQVLRILSAKLNFGWMISTFWDGGGMPVWWTPARNRWLPVVVYVKGDWPKDFGVFPDTIHVGDREKDWHPWQRTLGEVEKLVQYFTQPGDLVVEPCGGGFTTAVACRNLNRRCIACDCDPDAVAKGRQRLAESG